MSIIIIGKLLFGGATIAAVSVGSIFLHQYLNRYQGPYVYVVVESSSGSGSASESKFKCKLAEATESSLFSCKVEQLNWGSKNHLDYSSIAKTEATESAIKVAHNVFKITVPQAQYESVKNTDKKIEISSSKDNKEHVTANAKILFTVDEDGKTFNGKAEYFVAKAPAITGSLVSSNPTTDKYQCSWTRDVENSFKDCEIYDFAATGNAENGYSSLIFQKPESTTKSTDIVENKHYLIKFTESIKTDDNNLDKTKIVFIKQNAESETITFSGIKPSLLIEDKLLILGSQ